MRIALVINKLDPQSGGVEHWTCQFASSLAAAGHEVHVLAERFASQTAALPIARHVVAAGSSRMAFAAAVEAALARLPVDVVHDTGAGWHCHVFQPHGGSRQATFEQNLLLLPEWLRPLKRRLTPWLPRYREFAELSERQYADDGRIVLALSRMVARDMERFHGVRPERVRTVYNGVDVDRFSPAQCAVQRPASRAKLGLSADDVLLLIVAHNFRLKGVPVLLEAVGLLANEGWPIRLAVVGDGHLARFAGLARVQGAGRVTRFLGPVADPASCYAAADVYVQPTWYDPCSLVVLEALACGLPIVTSRFNGAAELISEGAEGYVLDDPGDVSELAGLLRRLCDPCLRRRLGEAGRRLALDHTLERNRREIVAVYHEVAARRRLAA